MPYNPGFNASNGIYRDAIRDIIVERSYTDRWKNWYESNAINDNGKTLVMTHMPYTDWAGNEYPDNCIYICGHIHDCHHGEAQTIVNDYHKGDAANGYRKTTFDWKIVDIIK